MPLRILLVADNDYCLRMLARILARDGHEVSAHASADDALREVARIELSFDALVSDLDFEDAANRHLLARLRGEGTRLFVLTNDVMSVPVAIKIDVYEKPSGIVGLMASLRAVIA